jgi:hypothetical protein
MARAERRCKACGSTPESSRFTHCESCGAEPSHTEACVYCSVAITTVILDGGALELAGPYFIARPEPWPGAVYALLAGHASLAPEPFMRGLIADGPLWREHAAVCSAVPAAA